MKAEESHSRAEVQMERGHFSGRQLATAGTEEWGHPPLRVSTQASDPLPRQRKFLGERIVCLTYHSIHRVKKSVRKILDAQQIFVKLISILSKLIFFKKVNYFCFSVM